MRILASVPQMYIGNCKIHLRCISGNRLFCNLLSFICDHKLQLIHIFCSGNKHLNRNLCIRSLDQRCHRYCRTTIVVQIKMRFAYGNHIYVSIQTSVEGEVCHLRIHMVIWRVVHCHNNLILFCKKIRNIDSPGRITAIVTAGLLAVDIERCTGIGSLEFHIHDGLAAKFLTLHCLRIVTGSAVIIVAAILPVNSVPCMRKVKCFPIATIQYG